ncbi:ADP-ribosylglycohydrolase family protein [Pseudoflavitalea sp. G-6-1-2]|uniref:ADP-ribosylglycohydrolase family protein n=1 Tax=Pseudoflavitalea sp. G-6-1-2 TaxID=2728841 RepID=UPI00146E988E|nr:ADP-ribosylglycohydrolase family protein [Pseudoflavitalea sp. G-6-1-2]NML21398.1 ADP-ribosylglycohydrolase family protein [Pseudoflavitalea sp. G-6-1-2]
MNKEELSGLVKSVLFGVAVGDALGVPVEFRSREGISQNPVSDMIGYGTHNQPPGTWSDDSSLTFCLAEALTLPFSLQQIADNFIQWRDHNYWTARGNVFDIGNATNEAITTLKSGTRPDLAGGFDTSSNGNGSLMRIAPLAFYVSGMEIDKRYETIKLVSSITHAHIRSVIACFYYIEFCLQLMKGENKFTVYENLKGSITAHLIQLRINTEEVMLFDRLLKGNIYELPNEQIFSSGYVLHTLEASVWSLLTSDNYHDAVLKAVNLGSDTDTTGAVTGALCALLYGYDNIPQHWIDAIARRKDIDDLSIRLTETLYKA